MLTGPPPKFNGTRDILMSARGQFFMSADIPAPGGSGTQSCELRFCLAHLRRTCSIFGIKVALLHEPGSGETGRHASGSEMS